jgi:transcriptional regulator with XRE-family HTH domain
VKTLEITPKSKDGDLLRAIGETLRAERTERGLTLKQVAEGAHVSVSYLAEIERGEKDPSSRVLESIAGGLEVEISELLVRIASSLEPAPSFRSQALWPRSTTPPASACHPAPVLPQPGPPRPDTRCLRGPGRDARE